MQQGKTLLAVSALLSLTTLNAHATSTASDGSLVVYITSENDTWTKDGDLLATLENAYGYSTIVNAVIAVDPVIHSVPTSFDNGGSGNYILSASDFGNDGTVDWWAANAYAAYLNSIDYGGSNQWSLPISCGYSSGSNCISMYIGDFFSGAWNGWQSVPFTNTRSSLYYFGNEQSVPGATLTPNDGTWAFGEFSGVNPTATKTPLLYAWAVSPGQVSSAVPLPSAVWLFLTGILGLLSLKRNGSTD